MSTRSQIEFVQDNEKLLFYQHCDGYPDGIHGMVAKLRGFFNHHKDGTNNYIDLPYFCTDFLRWNTGAAVYPQDCHPGDLEWFYVVDLETKTISVYQTGCDQPREQWKLVSVEPIFSKVPFIFPEEGR